jgi:hypothetical protein
MKLFRRGLSLKASDSDNSSRCSNQVKVDELDEINFGSSKMKSTGKSLFGRTYTVSTSGSSEDLQRDLIDFKISIELIDGIISTNTGRRHQNIGQLGAPVFGIISYSTRLPENGKIVKTNVPSMPLVKSKSSIGNRERFHAGFGYPNGELNTLEQIHLTLPMTSNKSNERRSKYRERRLDLDINLMRGSEVIKFGFASIALCGNEVGESKLVPVSQEKLVRTTRKKGNKRIPQKKKTTIGVKSVSFMKDPSRRFSLQRANVRVSVEAKSRKSTTSKHTKKNVGAPIVQIASTDKSDAVSVITSAREAFNCSSNDDSLLDKLSGISLSQSEETIAADQKYSQFLASVRNPSVDESDHGTICTTGDETLSKIGSMNFADSSSVFSGVDTDGDDTVTTLDNVSLGTIKFKALSNDDEDNKLYNDVRKAERSRASGLFQRSKLYR